MGDRETRTLASTRSEGYSEIRTSAIEPDAGSNRSIVRFNANYASGIFHPFFPLEWELDVYVKSRSS